MFGRRVLRVLPQNPHLHHPLQTLQAKCSSLPEFGVIKIPVGLQKKMKVEKLKEKRKEREKQLKQSRMGNREIPILTCRKPALNHYKDQTYNKFAEVPLASKGWRHKKSVGDYFTIMRHSQNPAFLHCENDTEKDFTSLGLDSDIVLQLQKMGIERPTNIQSASIPQVLKRRNTLITAETGNGKTLAFIGPMLQQIKERKTRLTDQPFNAPLGLVISPSKELATQIHRVAAQIGRSLGLKVKVLIGGRTKRRMLTPPMSQVDLLVASFGALSKLTTVGVYNMNYLTHITLDEADTLLDDSFNEAVIRYMTKQPIQNVGKLQQPQILSGVQLTLVAATTPKDISKVIEPIVDLDSVVQVSTPHLNRVMPHVMQRFLRVNSMGKKEKLLSMAKRDATNKRPLIIFSNNSKTSDWVSIFLNENGVPCVNLNSTMSLFRRQKHYDAFRNGDVKVLSCTDITSRGLDTHQVSHVINYEFPSYIADYIHRCGRTGRVGSSHNTLVTNMIHKPWEVELVQKIEYAVRKEEEFQNVDANIKRIIADRHLEEEEIVEGSSII